MPALQDSIDAIRIAAAAADRMKAEDVVAYDVGDKLGICDLMMIATASNERQVLAVAEEIEKQLFLKAGKRQPRSREGLPKASGCCSTTVISSSTSCTRNPANTTVSNGCGRTARASIYSSNTPRASRSPTASSEA